MAIKLIIDDFLTWTSRLMIQLLNFREFFLLSLQVCSNPSSQLATPSGWIGCLDVQFLLKAVGKKLDFLPLPLHSICTTKLLLLQSSNFPMGRPPISWMIRCSLKLMLEGEKKLGPDFGRWHICYDSKQYVLFWWTGKVYTGRYCLLDSAWWLDKVNLFRGKILEMRFFCSKSCPAKQKTLTLSSFVQNCYYYPAHFF